jgi:hypothetical protein
MPFLNLKSIPSESGQAILTASICQSYLEGMLEPNYLFIIAGQQPEVLHPFSPDSEIFSSGVAGLYGRYGTSEMPKDTTAIRTYLYSVMEKSFRHHLLDKGYIGRIVLTALAFLGIYLFASIVIRDPVPLLDELLLAGLAAGLVYFGLERRTLGSSHFVDTLVTFRKAIDSTMFTESRVVDLVEAWRDDALIRGPASFYTDPVATVSLNRHERAEASALCSMFARRWRAKPIVAALYEATRSGTPPGKLLDALYRKLGSGEAALVLAYLKLLPCVVGELQDDR